MPALPCLFVACAPSGSRIHPPYVNLFRKHCPAESTRFVERPKNQGPEQLRMRKRLLSRAHVDVWTALVYSMLHQSTIVRLVKIAVECHDLGLLGLMGSTSIQMQIGALDIETLSPLVNCNPALVICGADSRHDRRKAPVCDIGVGPRSGMNPNHQL